MAEPESQATVPLLATARVTEDGICLSTMTVTSPLAYVYISNLNNSHFLDEL